jgi:predicted DNA-binding protein with PD1-like motif
MISMKSKKLKKEDLFVLRLFKEEEMFSKIKEFCTVEGITSASFTVIGALKKATLGFFNLERME